MTKSRSRRLRRGPEGWVEGLRGKCLQGWVFDPDQPLDRLEVELVLNDRTLERARASHFRKDLADAGKTDGHCGFFLPLPFHLLSGQEGELCVRETNTGLLLGGLHGAKLLLPQLMQVEGRITGIESGSVVGWVRAPVGPEVFLRIELWIDGAPTLEAEAHLALDIGLGFRVRIPDTYQDGRPHEFAICIAGQAGPALDRLAAIAPAALTPFDALQRHAGMSYLKGPQSPVGPWRYESLRRALDHWVRAAALECPDALPASATGTPQLEALRSLQVLSQCHTQGIHGFPSPLAACTALAFPLCEQPRVSVVIPVHNQFEVTHQCLASLAAAPNRASFELVLVDDGSTDRTVLIEQWVSGLTVVRHEVAGGFVHACNAGAAVSRGEFIVLLNNDTEVATGWLDELLEPFERFERVGAVGGKLLYPDGRLQEAGGIVWGDGEVWNLGRGGNPAEPRYNYTRQVDYISGACLMLPAAMWRELDGLDRHFAPAYYEDTDLAFRVRELGYKTVYTPFCEVVHHEGLSNGRDVTGEGLKRFQVLNEPKFRSRWAATYRSHGKAHHESAHIAQDRMVELRALMLDAQTLTPDIDAGSYSATQEIRLLQSLGFKVTFVPANMAYMGGYTEQLQRMGVEVVYAPFALSMTEVVERRGDEFDLVWIARHNVAEQVIDAVRKHCPRARTVLNIHDLHFLRELREAVSEGDAVLMQRALATRDTELAVLRRVDLAVSYSEVEQAVILSHNLDSTKMALCPWVAEAADQVPGFDERIGIAFLGGFGHRPNVAAIEWFMRSVMPCLRDRLPGVPLSIYGSKLPPEIAALAGPDVQIEGYVRDVRQAYDRARVFVAPLLAGAGLKGKVVGAFARGVPTVMTPTAAEGTGARHRHDAMVLSSPDDWADAIALLHQDRAAWQRMSQACLQLAADRFSFENGRKVMSDALQVAGVYATSSSKTLWSRLSVG